MSEQRPVVAAIVTSFTGVLIARRNDGEPPWTFIGGKVEPGESPAEAAVREVREETGLQVHAGEEIGRRVHPRTGRAMVYVAARPTDGTGAVVRATDELAEVRWVSLAEADELMNGQIFEPVRQYLQQTLENGNGDQGRLARHSVSAGAAVIREDGRVLAIRRADNGEWAPPGGVVELHEDPRDTVRREVLEETGVTVEPGQLTGVYKNMRIGVVSLVFRCQPLSGTHHPTEEAIEVAWLDRDQITERMTSAFAIRLTDALDASEPRVRIHDGRELLG